MSEVKQEQGNLSINSENLFPIIKKWLYSDHDIFYRELISNGCDAITKLKKLDMMGEYTLPADYKAKIQVIVNPEEKTLKLNPPLRRFLKDGTPRKKLRSTSTARRNAESAPLSVPQPRKSRTLLFVKSPGYASATEWKLLLTFPVSVTTFRNTASFLSEAVV